MTDTGLHIELKRSGGFTGMVRQTVVDSGDLPPEEAAELEGLVAAAIGSAGFRRPTPARRAADRFQYDLSIRFRGQEHAFTMRDGQMPAEFESLISHVLTLSRRR